MPTSIRKASAVERAMFKKGFLSIRLVSYKVHYTKAHVAKLIRDGHIDGVKVGRLVFANRASVRKYIGKASAELWGFDDWSDVLSE